MSGTQEEKEKEREKEKVEKESGMSYEEENEKEKESVDEPFDFGDYVGIREIEEMALQQGVTIRHAREEDLLGILEMRKVLSPSVAERHEAHMDFLFNLYRLDLPHALHPNYSLTHHLYFRHFPQLLFVCVGDGVVIGYVAAVIETGSSIFRGTSFLLFLFVYLKISNK